MSKTEALEALEHGEKITHQYFSSDEFLEKKGGFYYDEKQYQLNIEGFWNYRKHASWEEGW